MTASNRDLSFPSDPISMSAKAYTKKYLESAMQEKQERALCHLFERQNFKCFFSSVIRGNLVNSNVTCSNC